LGTGLSLTLLVAAVLLTPFGVAAGGSDLLDGRVLAIGLAVAVLGSVLPFTLELAALHQLSAAAFGILLSLEPAVAAFAGAVALSQVPDAVEAVAIVLVVVASAGASLGARRIVPPDI
jgi:inner membrane transporter RhtA